MSDMRCGRCASSRDTASSVVGADEDRPFALPGATAHFPRNRTCDVRHIRLDLSVDLDARRIEGTCATTFVPLLDGTRSVELDAIELDIESVVLEDGTPLAFAVTTDLLRVDLGAERAAGDAITVVIRYRTHPRRGVYFIHPDEAYPERPKQLWSQGQDEDARRWFPCVDIPGVKATSEVIATVPAPMVALSNGRLIDETSDGARKTRTFRWRQDVPHAAYLVTLVVGEYEDFKETRDGVELDYYVPKGREADGRRTFARTGEMVHLFGDKIGLPYPYGRYAQVVVAEFIFGGMENTTQTTLTDAALYDERAALDHSSDPLISHELAHQWFGDLLTCRDWTHAWLNEGFATYFESVWREHNEGRDERDQGLRDDAEAYMVEDRERYRRPIVANTFHEPIDLFDRHLYEKGAWVLHMLRAVLGDGPFWKGIRHYAKKHARQSVLTADFARAVEEATGRSIDWFLDQWVMHGGVPDLKVEVSWDDATKLVRVGLKQTQKVDAITPIFRLPLEVRVVVGGNVTAHALVLDRAEQTFLLPASGAPEDVLVDPRNVVLKRLTMEKPVAMWRAQLERAPEAIARSQAAEALGKQADAQSVDALAKALDGDAFWGVRAACARALGAVRGTRALSLLVGRLKDEKHPKARRAIVRALGEFRGDAEASAVVTSVFDGGDASYFVEAESLTSLGKLRSPEGYDVIVRGLDRPSYLDVVACQGLEGLGELGDERAIVVAEALTPYGKPTRIRRAAIMALGRLADRAAKRGAVVEGLERLLDDPDFRVRIAVADALSAAADPRAVGSLQRALGRELDGRAKRRYREVIRELETGHGRETAVRELRDELTKLRDDQSKLRDRILALEALLPKPASDKTKT